MSDTLRSEGYVSHEGYIPVENVELYYRQIGQGSPVIVLHGGPDFDHSYLRPEMDRLSESFRLIYYDQRGRGKSADHVQPEDVSIGSDVEDVEAVRRYLQLESVTLLGHSWGVLLALEYAIRYPTHVSHLILMDAAPVSHDDYLLLKQDRREKSAADIEELKTRRSTARYQEGDPDAVAEYYRVHFRATIRDSEHLEIVIARLRASFTKDGILKARAIENRLMTETWLAEKYDLLPRLKRLAIPTLVIHGEYDFVPIACAIHIAQAIPGARFILLEGCGHFSYLDCPEKVHKEINDFIGST